jgi:hypothetical protein
MRRMLFAAVALLSLAPGAARAEAENFRKLEWQVVAPWEVAWIGNDKKVNHCILARGGFDAAPTKDDPRLMIVADRDNVILRVRAAPYRFTAARRIAVSLVTADGAALSPLAAVAGPDLVDIKLDNQRALLDRFAASGHMELRAEDMTVRLRLDRMGEALEAYDRCMRDIGAPAKGFSGAEIDEIAELIGAGRANCNEDGRTGVLTCEKD